MTIVAMIPAFNEAENIVSTLTAVANLEYVDEIVVIDDGSSDDTSFRASNCSLPKKLTVLRLEENRGKGGALNHGRQKVLGDVYLLLDADLGTTASLAGALLGPILKDEADMTIARFSTEQSSSKQKMGFGTVRRVATLGVRLLTGHDIGSPLSGQRALTAQVLRSVGDFFEGFGVEVALTVGALHHGYRVTEVPLAMKHRALGRGFRGMAHRGRQLIHVLGALWHCWKRGWHL
jgi:glycosyltransferase involved in cell wall biosynthesis